jgi:hypothetical protein
MDIEHLASAYIMGSHTVYEPLFILKSKVNPVADVSLTYMSKLLSANRSFDIYVKDKSANRFYS